jgi:putative PIG3 family NAD(P)H quinone oxidoreductase
MRAVIFDAPGDESVLRVGEVDPPELTEDGVRIAVAAAGLNRADLLQRRGLYPPPPGASPILGLECAGRIVEVGRNVTSWGIGDRVMALLAGGGYADEVVTPASCVVAIPPGFSDTEAGAFPEAFATAFLNLFLLGDLREGNTVLIQGGSGGVGTAAIQLCSTAGALTCVTAGSDARCRRCSALGAEHAFNYRSQDFVRGVLDATEERGADVVLDCVGGAYLDRHLEVLAPDGRLVVIGLMGGRTAEIDLGRVLTRRLRIIGSTLRSLPADRKGTILTALMTRFGDPISNRSIRPVVDRVLPFSRAAEAHRLMAGGGAFGKIVLTPVEEEAPSTR